MAATSEAKRAVPASMPIEGYDRLSIKEILPLLKTLNSRELKAVTAYEKAGKNRVTLLRGVRQIELAREAVAPKRAAKPRLKVVEVEAKASPRKARATKARAAEARQEIAAAATDFSSADDIDDDVFDGDVLDADDIEAGHEVDEMEFLDSDFAPMELTDLDFAQVEFADTADTTDDSGNADANKYVEYAEYAEYDDLDIAPPPPPKAATKPVAPKPVAAKPVAAKPVAAKPVAAKPVAAKVVPVKESRSRRPAKAATWEEEIRPELPRRLQEAAVALEMEFETPSVARIGLDDTLHAVPEPIPGLAPSATPALKTPKAPKAKGPTALKTAKGPKATTSAAADKSPLVRRFESVALVMAAILAVLLGLAIGTVLARSGSTDASPTPTSVSSQASAVQSPS